MLKGTTIASSASLFWDLSNGLYYVDYQELKAILYVLIYGHMRSLIQRFANWPNKIRNSLRDYVYVAFSPALSLGKTPIC